MKIFAPTLSFLCAFPAAQAAANLRGSSMTSPQSDRDNLLDRDLAEALRCYPVSSVKNDGFFLSFGVITNVPECSQQGGGRKDCFGSRKEAEEFADLVNQNIPKIPGTNLPAFPFTVGSCASKGFSKFNREYPYGSWINSELKASIEEMDLNPVMETFRQDRKCYPVSAVKNEGFLSESGVAPGVEECSQQGGGRFDCIESEDEAQNFADRLNQRMPTMEGTDLPVFVFTVGSCSSKGFNQFNREHNYKRWVSSEMETYMEDANLNPATGIFRNPSGKPRPAGKPDGQPREQGLDVVTCYPISSVRNDGFYIPSTGSRAGVQECTEECLDSEELAEETMRAFNQNMPKLEGTNLPASRFTVGSCASKGFSKFNRQHVYEPWGVFHNPNTP